MSDSLERMANRVAEDPFFLACPLAEYARSERLDDSALAERLRCPIEVLAKLRLCRSPCGEEVEFKADITRIATAYGIDPPILAAAIRHGEGLSRLRETTRAESEPGHLLAARDSTAEPPAQEPPQ